MKEESVSEKLTERVHVRMGETLLGEIDRHIDEVYEASGVPMSRGQAVRLILARWAAARRKQGVVASMSTM